MIFISLFFLVQIDFIKNTKILSKIILLTDYQKKGSLKCRFYKIFSENYPNYFSIFG